MFIAHYDSPIGKITLLDSGGALSGLFFGEQSDFLQGLSQAEQKDTSVLLSTKRWLDDYFGGKKPNPYSIKLALSGSAFRLAVYRRLLELPYGETITYGELAREMAPLFGKNKMSAQAIGGAVGHNAIPIIIPCHRVIGANGNLVGYSGGIPLKIKLLAHEGLDISKYSIPQ